MPDILRPVDREASCEPVEASDPPALVGPPDGLGFDVLVHDDDLGLVVPSTFEPDRHALRVAVTGQHAPRVDEPVGRLHGFELAFDGDGPTVRQRVEDAVLAGISGETGTGFHPGTPATKSILVWQDQNGDGLVEPNEIVAIGGSPATPSRLFRRFALGGDARLIVRIAALGDLSVRIEAVSALNLDRGVEVADPIGAGHDLREMGWSAGATQEVTRWAMVGARYDLYNPNADASQQRASNLVPADRSYSTFALMAMLRYEGARLLLEYDINKNPLGIGANGAPTNLADNQLTLRAQAVF